MGRNDNKNKNESDGSLDTLISKNWSAIENCLRSNSRKIWSAVPGSDYRLIIIISLYQMDRNNVGNLMQIYDHDIIDYHKDSNNSSYQSNKLDVKPSGVIDGTAR